MDKEVFGEFAVSNQHDYQEEDDEGAERRRAAHVKRISDAFEMPLPDVGRSLIGPEAVNIWTFYISSREYPTITHQLFKYALVNCPHLQFFELNNARRSHKVLLSSSRSIQYPNDADKSDPSGLSQVHLKWIQFEALLPTQE